MDRQCGEAGGGAERGAAEAPHRVGREPGEPEHAQPAVPAVAAPPRVGVAGLEEPEGLVREEGQRPVENRRVGVEFEPAAERLTCRQIGRLIGGAGTHGGQHRDQDQVGGDHQSGEPGRAARVRGPAGSSGRARPSRAPARGARDSHLQQDSSIAGGLVGAGASVAAACAAQVRGAVGRSLRKCFEVESAVLRRIARRPNDSLQRAARCSGPERVAGRHRLAAAGWAEGVNGPADGAAPTVWRRSRRPPVHRGRQHSGGLRASIRRDGSGR